MKKNISIPISFYYNNDNVFSAAVAFYSLLEHADKKYDYIFYVLHSNISEDNQKKLKETIKDFTNCSINYIQIDKNTNLNNYLENEAFNNIDKLIVSSNDVVYLNDISKPFIDLIDKEDFYISGIKQISDIKEKNTEKYSLKWNQEEINDIFKLNEGFYILNLKKIKNDKYTNIIERAYSNNKNRIINYNRDVFNIAFKDNVKYLNSKYEKDQIVLVYDDKPWIKVDNDESAIWFKYIINTPFAKDFLISLPITIELPENRIVHKEKTSLYRKISNRIPYNVRLIVKHPSYIFKREYKKRLKRKFVHKDYSYIIFDDVFPCHLSPFRHTEFMEYILDNKNTFYAVTGLSLLALNEQRPLKNIIKEYEESMPVFCERFIDVSESNRYRGLKRLKLIHNPLAIFVFERNIINELYDNLSFLEENNIPFVITLYPGGGLIINDKNSDEILKRIFSSKCFRKVIVTQDNVKNYLLSKKLCDENDIEFIFGIVTPEHTLDNSKKKRVYYPNKETLDICFVSHRYLPKGEDKGYDLFIESAKKIIQKNPNSNIRFHVVGGFSKDDINVDKIKDYISFYGIISSKELDDLLINMDIIVSPTRPFVLSKGSFDGFPTGSTTNAMLNGVLAITTDELKLNNNRFVDGHEIIIVKPNTNDIVNKVQELYNDPNKLKTIAKAGRAKAKKIYSLKEQMDRRLKLVNSVAKKEYNKKNTSK